MAAIIESWFEQDLKKPVQVQVLNGNVFSQDHNGNLVGVKVYDGGEPAALTGSVNAYCILADGATVPVDGTRQDNMAYIMVPQSALAVPGTIRIVIKLTEVDGNDDVTNVTTLAAIVSTVYRTKTDTVITPSSQVISDWSQDIAAEIQNCADARASLGTIIAEEYSTTKTYAVGEYVMKSGTLYRCTTAVTTAGSWSSNSSKFTAVKLGADVCDLKSAFVDEAISEFGIIDLSVGNGITDGKYIRKSDGKDTSSTAGWSFTDYIELHQRTLLFTCPEHSNAYSRNIVASIGFYEDDKTYITDKSIDLLAGTTGQFKWIVASVPSGARYFRATIVTSMKDDYKIIGIDSFDDVVTNSKKIYCVGNSFLTGSVYEDDHVVFFESGYENAIYGQIAMALGISCDHTTNVFHPSTGFLTEYSGTSTVDWHCHLDEIKETDLTGYDYLLTHFNGSDLRHKPLGSVNSEPGKTSIAAGVADLVQYVKTNYGLCKIIILGTPPYFAEFAGQTDVFNIVPNNSDYQNTLAKMDTLMYALAEKYHFIYVSWQDLEISYHLMDYCDYTEGQTGSRHGDSKDTYRALGTYAANQVMAVNSPIAIKTINDIENIVGSYYATRETLTNTNDLNELTSPGVYYWSGSSVPNNAPATFSENSYPGRLLVVKSPTTDYHYAEWQVVITRNNVLWYRYCHTAVIGWTDWQEINPSYFLTVSKSLMTSSDDLNAIEKSGLYAYSTSNSPQNAMPLPSGKMVRLFVDKSSSTTDHSGEWQVAIVGNTVYFRSCASSTWSSWNVLNNDYQQHGNLAYLSMTNDHMIIQSDLSVVSNNSTSCTDYIAIPEDAKAVKVAAKTKLANGNVSTILPQVMFFDENKNYISRNRDASNDYGVFDIPLTAKYIRANQPASTVTDLPHLIQFVKYSDTYTPAYQVEELPYNAVLYHQKWDELLEDTSTDHVLRRVNLGNVDNDETLPIYAYEFCPNRYMVGLNSAGTVSTPVSFDWTNALYERPKILILGGVHGNEKCTPMDILTVVKMLKSKKYNDIACKFDWYIIPLVNPWGYSHAHLDSNGDIVYDNSSEWTQVVECSATINAGIRDNGHGMNINRDWSDVTFENGGNTYGFQTPELQLIKNYVLSIAPDFFIDVHQNHTDKTVNGTMSLTLCHAGAPIDPDNQDADYIALMKKIYRYIDIANADTNEIALGYATNNSVNFQTCRIWPTVNGTTSEHYFGGVTVTSGGVVLGNTSHQAIKTPYSLCSETSEICADFANTTAWYNPVARTISYSYLWNIIKQIAKLF